MNLQELEKNLEIVETKIKKLKNKKGKIKSSIKRHYQMRNNIQSKIRRLKKTEIWLLEDNWLRLCGE